MTWVAQGNHVISQQQRIDWRFAEEEGRRESQRDSKHLIDALPLVVNMGGGQESQFNNVNEFESLSFPESFQVSSQWQTP